MRPIATWKSCRQRGDTLVEVLIAIAVVSMVLGGAYAVTNRSLLATRAAQERAIALKLAESQVERIKGIMATNPDSVMTMTGDFCIAANTGLPVASTNSACLVDTDGNPAPSSVQPAFRIVVNRSGNTFTVTEGWEDVNGKQTDSLQLRYRVYE